MLKYIQEPQRQLEINTRIAKKFIKNYTIINEVIVDEIKIVRDENIAEDFYGFSGA